MTENILFLPLVMALIFWVYREFCHIIDKANWRQDLQRMLRGDLTVPTGSSQVILPPDTEFYPPPPDEELTPAQLEEREEELKARLQRDRLAQLQQEKLDALTSESEAAFSEFTGST